MDKYGLIGFPLGHSFSKNFFNEKFENENIDAEYINFEIPNIEGLVEILDVNPELRGLNVTIPYKEKRDKLSRLHQSGGTRHRSRQCHTCHT